MPITATDIINQACQLIGNNVPPVTGVLPDFDTSPAGQAAKYLYTPCVETVGRQFAWDFARRTVGLTLTSNAAPFPWAFEYAYPPNGIQVWQLSPKAALDPNDPLPVNFLVANAVVGTEQARVIHTDLADAQAIYNNNPSEDTWDSTFREAVVRLLASEIAMALAGRPETAQGLLSSSSAFEGAGESRQD